MNRHHRNTKDFKRILWKIICQKMDNIEEMDKFLETYSLPKQNQEEIDNLNRLIISKESEMVIKKKKTPPKWKFSTRWIHKWILPDVYRRHIYSTHTVPKKEEEGKLLNTFHEASITLIAKQHKDTTKKENYGFISLMNIGAKILNKILANSMQEYIKKVIHHYQVDLFPGSMFANQSTSCTTSVKQRVKIKWSSQ